MGSIEKVVPPVAKKVKHEMETFGDVRNDNYYWLRDDSRSDPHVLSYLHQENAYTDFVMSGMYISLLHLCLSTIYSLDIIIYMIVCVH